MRTYLCTVGTSAAKGIRAEPGSWFGEGWVAQRGGVEAAALAIYQTMAHGDMQNQDHLEKVLSAEIHSLARMPLETGDRVVLYASETSDGRACAQAVELYLREQGYETLVKVIEGLQVRNAERFRALGVPNFVRAVLSDIESCGAEYCILNPTGGFKALVPYTVLIGMLRRVPSRYIFEQSSELITLPPFPLDFSRSLVNDQVRSLLKKIEEQTFIPVSEFEATLPYGLRQSLMPLFEIDGAQVSLSAIGILVHEDLRRPVAYRVYLSQKAVAGIKGLKSRADTDPVRFLGRVAADRNAFENARHANVGEGFSWLKPGSTTDRYLVSIEGDDRMLVWEAVDHQSYDRMSTNPELGKACLANRRAYGPFLHLEEWLE